MTFIESFPKARWLSLEAKRKPDGLQGRLHQCRMTFIGCSTRAGLKWLSLKVLQKQDDFRWKLNKRRMTSRKLHRSIIGADVSPKSLLLLDPGQSCSIIHICSMNWSLTLIHLDVSYTFSESFMLSREKRESFPIFHSCRKPPPTEGARDRNIRELKVLGLLAGSPEGRLWAFRVCLTLSFVSLALRPCDPRKVYLLFPPLFPVIPNDACVHNLVSMTHVSRMHKSWCIFQWYTYPYKYKYTRIHGACMCPRSMILYPWLVYPWSCIHDACMHVSKIHVSMVFTQVWHGQHRWSIIES